MCGRLPCTVLSSDFSPVPTHCPRPHNNRPWPRRGKLVIVLSLQDGRREGEIACRGEGAADSGGWSVSGASGGKGAAGSATVDLADWDGDQDWGGSLLYPPAALRLCHDEPSLQVTTTL